MEKVKWGVLGCSGFAARRSIPAMLQSPSVELVGVASRSQEKAESFQSQFGLPKAYKTYDDLLDDPHISAVHIPLPNSMHEEWTAKALKKNKHVLCEKPFTTNADEADRAAEFAKRTGLKFMEGLVWRFHPQHEYALKAVLDGRIGEVRMVRSSFSFPLPPGPNIRREQALGGGCLLDVGGYPVSSSRYYFREEPNIVFAVGEIDKESQVDSGVGCTLQFSRGMAMFDCNFNLPFRTELEVVGSKGRIFFPRAWQPMDEAAIYVDQEEVRFPSANQYVLMFEHFTNCIKEGTQPRYGMDDAVRQMKVISAIRRSMNSGQAELI